MPNKEAEKKAQEIIKELDVLTAGEGEYGEAGIYANRYPPDVRKSDTHAWLIEQIATALTQARREGKVEGMEMGVKSVHTYLAAHKLDEQFSDHYRNGFEMATDMSLMAIQDFAASRQATEVREVVEKRVLYYETPTEHGEGHNDARQRALAAIDSIINEK